MFMIDDAELYDSHEEAVLEMEEWSSIQEGFGQEFSPFEDGEDDDTGDDDEYDDY